MTDELQGLARYIDAVSAPVDVRDVTDRARRRRSRSRPVVAVAIAAATAVIAAIVAGVVAFGPRSHTGVSPASTPATLVAPVRPAFVAGPASAANREPVFLSTTDGWICDTPLRFTTDGGVTWQPISVGTTKIVYNDPCAFVSGGHAWIAIHGAPEHPIPSIVRVVAGRRPEVDPVPLHGATPNESISSLAFADALHGWAATTAYGRSLGALSNVYRTTDGGMHWQRIARNVPVSSMRFTSPTMGWGVAGRRMERTNDGGRTWRSVPIVPTPAPTTSYVGSLDKVFVFGDRIVVDGFLPTGNFGQSFIETSNDDGVHWSLQTISTNIIQPPGTAPWEFIALDATHWRFGLGSEVVVTDNGGKTWHQRPMHLPTDLLEMTGISFVTPDIGWAVGCDTTCYTVAFTNDAGRSWRVLAPADRTTIPTPFPLFELPSTVAVLTGAETPDNPAGATFSADQSYAVGSDVVHVWQTNNADLGAKDPTSQPDATPIEIAGARWWQSSVSGEPTHLWMAMRTSSGITVEIDGKISLDKLESLAGSLAQNQGK